MEQDHSAGQPAVKPFARAMMYALVGVVSLLFVVVGGLWATWSTEKRTGHVEATLDSQPSPPPTIVSRHSLPSPPAAPTPNSIGQPPQATLDERRPRVAGEKRVAADSAYRLPSISAENSAEVAAAKSWFATADGGELAGELQPVVCSADRSLGTALTWCKSPQEAEQQARREGKLVFLIHVSGNFEDAGFT